MAAKGACGPKSLTHLLTAMSRTSPAQRAMLETLTIIGQSATISEIAKQAGLHNNSARETLDALVETGLVSKSVDAPKGRGRPAWRYEITAPDIVNGFERQISDLLVAAARTIMVASNDPDKHASEMGRQWGQQFLESGGFNSLPETPMRELERLDPELYASHVRVFLSTQGFQASPGEDASKIELRSCPFLVEDQSLQKLICTIHASMFAHVVGTLSNGSVRTELYPFVKDGACQVVLDFKAEAPADSNDDAADSSSTDSPAEASQAS